MRGATLQSLRCVVLGKKISLSYNSCRFSVVFASVGFNINRVTTQHTSKCAKNCSDNKVFMIVLLTLTRFSVSSVKTLKTAVFSLNCRQIICFETVYSMCTDRDVSINNTKMLLI